MYNVAWCLEMQRLFPPRALKSYDLYYNSQPPTNASYLLKSSCPKALLLLLLMLEEGSEVWRRLDSWIPQEAARSLYLDSPLGIGLKEPEEDSESSSGIAGTSVFCAEKIWEPWTRKIAPQNVECGLHNHPPPKQASPWENWDSHTSFFQRCYLNPHHLTPGQGLNVALWSLYDRESSIQSVCAIQANIPFQSLVMQLFAASKHLSWFYDVLFCSLYF